MSKVLYHNSNICYHQCAMLPTSSIWKNLNKVMTALLPLYYPAAAAILPCHHLDLSCSVICSNATHCGRPLIFLSETHIHNIDWLYHVTGNCKKMNLTSQRNIEMDSEQRKRNYLIQ